MAWSSPRTFVTGEVLTAALLNLHLRDQLIATGFTGTNSITAPAAGTVALYVQAATAQTADLQQWKPTGGVRFGISAQGDPRWSTSATTATTGASGAPPAQVAGYVSVDVGGTVVKIPFYNP